MPLELQRASFRGRRDFYAQFLHSLQVFRYPGAKRLPLMRGNYVGGGNDADAGVVTSGGRGSGENLPVVFLMIKAKINP